MIERSRVRVPAGAAGEFCSPGSTFCADWFRHPFHPPVTAAAHKRSRSFCQKCRWPVTPKHTCTRRMWLRMKRHSKLVHGCRARERTGAWLYFVWCILYGVNRTCVKKGSSFTRHQQYNNEMALLRTPHRWIFKNVLGEATSITHSDSHTTRARWVCSRVGE